MVTRKDLIVALVTVLVIVLILFLYGLVNGLTCERRYDTQERPCPRVTSLPARVPLEGFGIHGR
jgi:hypothetical protein